MQVPASPVHAVASPYRRHLPALDGLRGVAVLGVLIAHLYGMPVTTRAGAWLQGVVHFAGNGVVLFFVLSGFLITGILYESLPERGYFRKFYARRVLRIAPLYYAVLAGVVLTVLVLGKHYGRQPLSLALYLQNTRLVTEPIWEYSGHSQLPLLHFWTLAVEEQFYLVWPVLVFLLKDRRSIALAAIGGSLLSVVLRYWLVLHVGASEETIHCTTLCRLDTLLLGALLAMLVRSRWHDRALGSGVEMIFGGLALSWISSSLTRTAFAPTWLQGSAFALSYSGYAVACVGLLALALRDGRAFGSAALRWFGRYSYGLYVFHYMLQDLYGAPARAWISARGVSPGLATMLEGTGMAVLSSVLAWASYEVFEKQFLRLKRFVPYEGRESAAGN